MSQTSAARKRRPATITPVRTTLVSDLHLGTELDNDVARDPEIRARLAEGLADADRVVFLGDTIELREKPVEQVLEVAGPALADLAPALAGKQVTMVAGNHDHRLVEPLLDALRVGGGSLDLDWSAPAEATGLGRKVAGLLPDSEITLAYPGVRVRDDVYALHGHYLDMHMTVPRLEAILGMFFARSMLGRQNGGPTTPDEYERALGPLYALAYALAQGLGGKANRGHTSISRVIWERANRDDGRGGAAGAAALARGDPGGGRRAEPRRAGPVLARAHGRRAAPLRPARARRRGDHARHRRRPRDLRPHPPARPARG